MKLILNVTVLILLFIITSTSAYSQSRDTLAITGQNLSKRDITKSKASYLVYYKKKKEGPAQSMYVVNMLIEPVQYQGKAAVAITQRWEKDTVIHTAYTVLDAANYATWWHEYSWKRWKFSPKFDFINEKIEYEGTVPDSTRETFKQDFEASIDQYNLNWHSDLFIFSLLPYQENVTFKISFFDPGFGKAQNAFYSVTGSETLTTSSGKQIDCWILERSTKPGHYQRFWINKNTSEVMKEEDFSGKWYRFKLKLVFAESGF